MSEWIPTKNQVPPIGQLVLCCGEKGGMFLGEAYMKCNPSDSYCCMSVPNARRGRHAVYWMPLPTLPAGLTK